jgi:Secretion system C-terminal sorting domain
MKLSKLIVLFLGSVLSITNASAQANASINILSLNSGQLSVSSIGVIQVTVGNTGPGSIAAFKVRAQISVPGIAGVLVNGQQTGLPPGWTITVNTGSAITICNGTDVIPAGIQRQIFIKLQGNSIGGPSTVNGQLLFSNGTSCAIPGSLTGDNNADNTSTTSITVIAAVACGLGVSSSAGTIACNGGTATITASTTGEAGAVEYSNSGGTFQPGNTFTAGAGSYVIIGREAGNTTCLQTAPTITITEPSAITASASGGTIACNGSTTTLTTTASGGTGSLEYNLNAGTFQPGNTFTVGAGTYTIIVRDANLCTNTPAPLTISEPPVLAAGGSVTSPITAPGGEGTITVTSNGGTDPKNYVVTSGTTINTTGATSGVFTNLLAGNYTFTATDGNSCNVTTASVALNDPIVTPVTLTDFNAALVNCQPVLHWITETEINSDRFEIERSILNNLDWTSIGTVAANVNSTTTSQYNFIDRDLNVSSEKVLYRLKMIDRDGSYKYSKVLRVFTNCNTIRVSVYPNPVKDGWLYVSVSGTSGYSKATLMSLSGQVLLKSKMNNGTNHLSVSNIADGVYILNIKDANGFDEKVKVFIQN